jgi:hypothetical protein
MNILKCKNYKVLELEKKKILILTTSVFTDRMLQHSTFLGELTKEFSVEIWAKSFVSNPNDWTIENVSVKPFPELKPLPNWTSYLRRVNEYAWMYALDAKSIAINIKYKTKKTAKLKFLLFLGKLVSILHLHFLMEWLVFKSVQVSERNPFLALDLKNTSLDYLMVLNPFWVEEPLVAIEAKKMNISIVSIIPSWDNITTKSRMLYASDYYGVWSSVRIKELNKYYPYTLKTKNFVFGTPQYDVFSNPDFLMDKKAFYNQYDLNEELPLLLYTLGSPLFITSEIDVCLKFCKLASTEGLLDKFQILVRPHPIKDFSTYIPKFNDIDSRIKIQSEVQTSSKQKYRFMDKQMLENWVSTFHYSDLIVATSSTTLLDASMLNKPHINITENLSDDKKFDSFLRDVSYRFKHLEDLNNNNLLNNVKNWDTFFQQLKAFFKDAKSIKNTSNALVLHLCEYKNEGKYGKLFAEQIIKNLK